MGIYGKITGILREFVFGLSIFFTIVGFIILLIGITGFVEDLNYIPLDIFGFSEDFLPWSFYILAAGAVIFGWFGVYYLYYYIINRKFVLEELETNKRSEFLKKHIEVKKKVKHLPTKYQKMLKDKEKELNIK